MRYSRDGFSVDAAIEKGRELPQWYLDEPLSLPGDERFLDAFWYLTTERRWALGPIPASKTQQYAYDRGWSSDIIVLFCRMIRKLDEAYLQWAAKEAKKETGQDKPRRRLFGRRKR